MTSFRFNALVPPFDEIGVGKEEITNENVKAAAGIEESKLSLPEVLKKTTTQSITGKKEFKPEKPADNEAATGATGPEGLLVEGSIGGNTTIKTTGTGGTGGKLKITSGAGGLANAAETSSTGGTGGAFEFISGAGAEAIVGSVAGTNKGGIGGTFNISSGKGGAAAGATEGKNTGGFGGTIKFETGAGGEGRVSSKENEGGKGGTITFLTGAGGLATELTAPTAKGGEGGKFEFKAGKGGLSEAATTSTGGAGGKIEFIAGTGGNASGAVTNKAGKGGEILLKGGKSGEDAENTAEAGRVLLIGGQATTAAKCGIIELRTGTAAEGTPRILVAAEGLTTIKSGLTVEGTLTLPASSITETFIKAEAVSKAKLAKAVQEELLTVAEFPALAAYTSAKEETETKPTFITLLVTYKVEATTGAVKVVNDAHEVVYQHLANATIAEKQQLTILVKKGGKWKATIEGSAEKIELSRQVVNSV